MAKELFNGNLASEISLTQRLAFGIPGSSQNGAGNIIFSEYLRYTGTELCVRAEVDNNEISIPIPNNSQVTGIDIDYVSGAGTIQAGTSSGLDDIIPNTDQCFDNVLRAKFKTGGNVFIKSVGIKANIILSYKYNHY